MEMWVRARRDPAVRDTYFRLDRRQRKLIADIVREGQQESGEFDRDADPDEFALALSGLMDGLGVQVTLGQPDVTAGTDGGALPGARLAASSAARPWWRAGSCEKRSASMHPREGWSEGGIRRRPDLGGSARSPAASCSPAGAGLALARTARRLQHRTNPARRREQRPPLPRKDTSPVKWPVYADNKPIASGLAPERGATLQLYNWVAYINEAVVKSFCKKYDCKYSMTTFNTIEEALAKLDQRASSNSTSSSRPSLCSAS